MDADTPPHTLQTPRQLGRTSCYQTVHPALHSSKSGGLHTVIVQYGAEEETRHKGSEVPGPSPGAATYGRCDFGPSGLVFAQLENGDSNSSLACLTGRLWKSDEVTGREVPCRQQSLVQL